MGEATLIRSSPSSLPSKAQAAWARPLRSSPLWSGHDHRHRRRRRKRHERGHSDHHHRHRRFDLADLSLFFGSWLFWLLVVGWFWLMVVGWSGLGVRFGMGIRFWLIAVTNIGDWWLIYRGGRWLWAMAVDLWCGLFLLLLLLMIMGKGIIYYFNV